MDAINDEEVIFESCSWVSLKNYTLETAGGGVKSTRWGSKEVECRFSQNTCENFFVILITSWGGGRVQTLFYSSLSVYRVAKFHPNFECRGWYKKVFAIKTKEWELGGICFGLKKKLFSRYLLAFKFATIPGLKM